MNDHSHLIHIGAILRRVLPLLPIGSVRILALRSHLHARRTLTQRDPTAIVSEHLLHLKLPGSSANLDLRSNP